MMSGSLYYMTIYFFQEKAEDFSNFTRWQKLVEWESRKLVTELPSDWGGEFFSGEFCEYFNEHGIKHLLTATYSPQQMSVYFFQEKAEAFSNL